MVTVPFSTKPCSHLVPPPTDTPSPRHVTSHQGSEVTRIKGHRVIASTWEAEHVTEGNRFFVIAECIWNRKLTHRKKLGDGKGNSRNFEMKMLSTWQSVISIPWCQWMGRD